jgi:hypothetical protein
MPQLIIRGIEAHKVCKISKEMVDELEALLTCPRNYFTIECINSTYVAEGKIAAGYPFIEIAWFDRGQELQDKVAEIVTKHVKVLGFENVDIVFKVLDKNRYYENGTHF